MPFARMAARDGVMEIFSRDCRDLSSDERLVEGAKDRLAGLAPRDRRIAHDVVERFHQEL
jgi:hypothetical protein